jgi:hypothetical protein
MAGTQTTVVLVVPKNTPKSKNEDKNANGDNTSEAKENNSSNSAASSAAATLAKLKSLRFQLLKVEEFLTRAMDELEALAAQKEEECGGNHTGSTANAYSNPRSATANNSTTAADGPDDNVPLPTNINDAMRAFLRRFLAISDDEVEALMGGALGNGGGNNGTNGNNGNGNNGNARGNSGNNTGNNSTNLDSTYVCTNWSNLEVSWFLWADPYHLV